MKRIILNGIVWLQLAYTFTAHADCCRATKSNGAADTCTNQMVKVTCPTQKGVVQYRLADKNGTIIPSVTNCPDCGHGAVDHRCQTASDKSKSVKDNQAPEVSKCTALILP